MPQRGTPERHEFDVTFIIGEVTLSELPIRVGPVEIVWSKFPPIVDDEKRVLQRYLGSDFREEWFTDGFAAADFHVEAAGHLQAIRWTYDRANILADLLSLRLGISDATFDLGFDRPPKVLGGVLVRRVDEPQARVYSYRRELLGYIDTDGEVNRLRRTFDQETFPRLLQHVPDGLFSGEPNEVHLRLRRALHWWAESRATYVLASKFLLSWIALESLSASPEDDWRQKGKLIKGRLAALASKHGWNGLRQKLLDDLWNLRRELVHEAVSGYFDSQAGHTREISSLLWATHYFLLLTVILALDLCESKESLLDMWDSLPTYEPSLVISHEQIPSRHFFIELSGSQETDIEESGS